MNILPKNVQINGKLDSRELKTIIDSIDSSILSFGKIHFLLRFPEDYISLDLLSKKAKHVILPLDINFDYEFQPNHQSVTDVLSYQLL